MTEIVIPAALRHARSQFRYIDQTGVTRGIYTAAVQTTSFGGDRVGCTIDFGAHGGGLTTEKSRRAQLLAFLMSLRGKQNRVYVADEAHTLRGSFPATELFANFDWSGGTTGWTGQSGASISASDGVGRVAVTAVGSNPQIRQSVTMTLNTPYVLRALIDASPGIDAALIGPAMNDNALVVSSTNYSATRGYRLTSLVPTSSGASIQQVIISSTSGYMAGTYFELPFISCSQCFLVDGGGNTHLQSNAIENAAWNAGGLTSRTANAQTAPDGTTTADVMLENSSASTHEVSQSVSRTSAAADLCSFGYFKRIVGTRNLRLTAGNTSANFGSAIFDLGAGTFGSLTNTGTATNTRAFMVDAGNGWYFCCVVSRAVAASTMAVFAQMVSAGSTSYTGDGTSSIAAWQVGMQLSSVPTRGAQTTSAAAAASTQTGSAIYVKGGPSSATGSLLVGDWFELDGQLKMVTAPLNFDAAGLARLEFSPPVRRAVSDNTPIIVCRPMGRFIFAGDNPGWSNSPGVFSESSIELEEAWS